MTSPLINSLRQAVAASPDDVPLRLHLAQQLAAAGDRDAAVSEAAAVLQREPSNAEALALITATAQPETEPAAEPAESPAASPFNWTAAETELAGVAEPMFVEEPGDSVGLFDVEASTLTLADVGGLQEVKDRLQAAFLAPLRNPEFRKLYGKSLKGGLLMYGPPGCGKTYLARAVAGELGAKFISVALTDVLDPYIGASERNLHEAFLLARRDAPCVLFFDEVDALGQRRSMTRNNAMRGTVNQLLADLDGVDASNDGVFVLAATNQPWDVDPALRRPGRFDRTVLVRPPDQPAREAIFRANLVSRPVEGIDLKRLADRTDGYSGADIAQICESAAERALLDGVRTNTPRLITMADLEAALADTQPSIGGWLDSARNVVLFANQDGSWNELRDYLKRNKRL